MSKQSSWPEAYLRTAREASYLTVCLALLLLGVAVWGLVSGLNEAQRLLQQSSNLSETKLVLLHLTGTKLLLLIVSLILIRVIALWAGRRFGYLLAIFVLLAIVIVVWRASIWSDHVLTGLILDQNRQGVMTGRPPAFMFGTSRGTVLPLAIAIFLNLACEVSVVVVSSYRWLFHKTDR